LISDIELVRFYGFGNETPSGRASDFFKAEQRQYVLAPSYRWGGRSAGVWLGAVGKFADTKLDPNTFIGITQPYGVEDFGQVGPQLSFVVDTRDVEAAAERGVVLRATGIYYPKVWSVERQFGDTSGEISTYLSPGPLTLALRAGGKKLWGDQIPFQEAAFIGGPGTVRGLRRNRFAGDASAFGNAELRLRLGEVNVFVPIKVGVFGFGDIGRVFVEGETSDVWHTGVGGGLSLAVLRPENTFTLTFAWPGALRNGRFTAADDNAMRVYLNGGFSF
jgi:outer membrane protein assembly factor BamA